VYIYIYIYIYIYTYIHTYIHTYYSYLVYIYTPLIQKHQYNDGPDRKQAGAREYTYIHTHTHTYIHTYIRIYIYIYTYIHTYTFFISSVCIHTSHPETSI
jgi:hypothetical protein